VEQTEVTPAALGCNQTALALLNPQRHATLGAPAKVRLRPHQPLAPPSLYTLSSVSCWVSLQEVVRILSSFPSLGSATSLVGAQQVYGRVLGKGAFGSVVESYNRLDGRYSAVKRVTFRSVCPPWVPLEQIELRHARILREVRRRACLPRVQGG
jgi:hypothetical protein